MKLYLLDCTVKYDFCTIILTCTAKRQSVPTNEAVLTWLYCEVSFLYHHINLFCEASICTNKWSCTYLIVLWSIASVLTEETVLTWLYCKVYFLYLQMKLYLLDCTVKYHFCTGRGTCTYLIVLWSIISVPTNEVVLTWLYCEVSFLYWQRKPSTRSSAPMHQETAIQRLNDEDIAIIRMLNCLKKICEWVTLRNLNP